jgi:hypothetical protein
MRRLFFIGCLVVIATCAAPATGSRTDGASKQVVSAQANIFGAGRRVAPSPGGGGGGVLPRVWRLPAGTSRTVTFSRVTGRVNPIVHNDAWNGPGGDFVGSTNVQSYRGISGIIDRKNAMFVVGVFLTNSARGGASPPRLDFTNVEKFAVLAPKIGQTFFIGNGVGRRYVVPARATRLFVGFADAYYYTGKPGWYGNNAGEVTAVVDVTTG